MNMNIQIRRPRIADAEKLLQITQNEIIRQNCSISRLNSIEEAQKEIRKWKKLHSKNCGRWVITFNDINEYIGDIGFTDYEPEHNRAEIECKLFEQYWIGYTKLYRKDKVVVFS